MISSTKARWGIVATVAVALVLGLSPIAGSARSASSNDPNQLELSVLSAVWWQWIYSVPLDENPGFDATGEFAFENQPFDDLIFLCGTFSPINVGVNIEGNATRSITVERGTAFFFPLINTEFDNVMFNTPTPGVASVVNNPAKGGLTIPQLRAGAANFAGSAYDLFCTLTPTGGKTVNVPYERVTSPVFPYFLPEDNIYAAPPNPQEIDGLVWPAVSDGYWAYIPPLAKGTYTLNFGGVTPNGPGSIFSEDITYYITVE